MKTTKLCSTIIPMLLGNVSTFVIIQPDPIPIATYTICVDKSTTSSDQDASFKVGHAFLRVSNKANYDLIIGYHRLSPNETVTIGLFEETDYTGKGVFYNREVFRYNKRSYPKPENYLELTYGIYDLNKISAISNEINNHNFSYHLTNFNCVHFVTETTEVLLDQELNDNFYPSQLYDDIKSWGAYKTDFTPYFTDEFYQYKNSTDFRTIYSNNVW